MVIAKRGLILGVTALMLTGVTVIGAGIHLSSQASLSNNAPKELIDEVWQIIDKTYVDGTFNQVDWKATRNEYLDKTYTSEEQAYDAIKEMLKKLDDPYTRFMDPEEFKNMQIDTSGELTGVGIQLTQDPDSKKLVVISPIEDTPAFDAGIQAKDIISKIDGQSTKGMNINEAVSLIRGPIGSQVILTIKRENLEIEFPIVRAKIEIHPVKYSQKESYNSLGKVGYIRLSQFSANAAGEMREAIGNLETQKVSGYILDLRSNPGGLLYASIEIARMWLKRGDIVSTVDRNGVTDRQKANNRSLTDKPLVVMVDGGSASASEILSGALQDNKRATLVGTKTFGKGLVQSVRSVGKGAGIAVTIAKYFTPNGRDINKLGIQPDVKIPLSEKQKETLQKNRDKIGTIEADPQYAKALDILNKEIAEFQNQTAQW
ncbi:C-terminal processing peptidase-2. Serine peptidase. MEROPS family S41A [Trichodesmium erythraeum IMS101]|uniref:Carboxyl-terminal-processing protease n=1 Tax=Trichodesmium erythraeum (strain IMS101) TaxID=203124 RepID=Q10W72_TRIEI|nr:PDZ domain-containing protein [Trichodesmium erythraeum GBRTRLIN201]MCH2050914.1 S41 family peptidase [Trichodesmium sp. ALOHA_ZT_67]MCL2928032.1 S41 family peptidase [Trichodesmium sp. MAG_R01]MDE5070068.1 S41 family peptidase [Trichodesmium sp. St4_bin8_1]MDE5070500.1 S41 family peptidase [Trichodesmium sp. St5_bin8]MDE5092622.1 S41 family peptidase [Trichodesmium sp. St18_bin3_1_1]MDE5094768.1 S41 family peptidase [Trichodesmium sp. St11_bin5]